MLAVLTLCIIVIAVLAWVWPMSAVIGFLAIALSNTPAVLVHDHGLPPVGALIVPLLLFLLIALTIAKREQPGFVTLLIFPFLGYFVLTAAPVFWAPDKEAALASVEELAKNLTIFLVLVGFLNTMNRVRLAVNTTALTLAAIAALTVVQFASGDFGNTFLGYANATFLQISGEVHDWRMSGPLPDPNFYAQLLVMAAPLAVAVTVTARSLLLRLVGVASVAAILVAIQLTYSRGAVLALLLVVFANLVMSRSRMLLFTAVAFLAPLVVIVLPTEAFDRIYTGLETGLALLGTGDISGDPAVVDRISVMRAAIRMFVDHPLLGIGPGQFASQYQDYAIRFGLDPNAPAAAHSLFLEIAAERGLIGMLLYATLILGAFKFTIARYHNLLIHGQKTDAVIVKALAFSLLGYLTTSAFLHDAYPRFFWIFFALMISTWGTVKNVEPPPADLPDRRKTMPNELSVPIIALKTFQRYAVLIIFTGALGGGLAAIQTASKPVVYSTGATLLYRFGREYFPITPAEGPRNWGENILLSLDNALTTEMHLLTSYEQAAATLAKEASGSATSQGVSKDEMPAPESVEAFREMLTVRRVQGATMLEIEIKENDPVRATKMLDVFLETYQERRNTLFRGDAIGFFDSQIEALNAKITEIRAKLKDAKDKYRSIENSTNFKQWAPGEPVPSATAKDLLAAETELRNLDGWISGLEYDEKEAMTKLANLEQQREEWLFSASYNDQMSPYIKVADMRPAKAVQTRATLLLQTLASALIAAFVAWGAAMLWTVYQLRSGEEKSE